MATKIEYDWLIVGAGIAGAVFAREMTDRGYKCLVIDKRVHYGGNCYCEPYNGVITHKYGAHIFHTDSDLAWDYFKKYTPSVRQLGIYTVQAISGGVAYPLPFNMYTFSKMWPDVRFPSEALSRIAEQAHNAGDTNTLEGAAIAQVGRDIFEKLIKGYTEKQWGAPCSQLPKEIIGRIPVRYTYDNNYYYCNKIGIPTEGYNALFDNLLKGIEVQLGCDFLEHRDLAENAHRIFYTGAIDALFGEIFGRLDYRSLRFETRIRDLDETQGSPVVNYCDHSVPYTRVIEHNLFAPKRYAEELVISYEYSQPYTKDAEPYYPIPTAENLARYQQYVNESRARYGDKYVFGGRLGRYKYFAMDDAILDTLDLVDKLTKR